MISTNRKYLKLHSYVNTINLNNCSKALGKYLSIYSRLIVQKQRS